MICNVALNERKRFSLKKQSIYCDIIQAKR
jgi:hypothetical protein